MSDAIDVARLKEVMSHFATGVTIVAGLEGDSPQGFTAQSFQSLSIEPPLVLICPGKSVQSWPRIRPGAAFCVNILEQRQQDICMAFASSKNPDKFDGVGWRPSPATGSPMINGAVAWIDCRLEAEHDGGDHTIVVGRVEHVDIAPEPFEPLVFYRAAFGRFQA